MGYTIDSWIDEMNLLKSDKEKRKKTGHDIYEKMGNFLLRQLTDLIEGVFLISVTSLMYREELIDLYMTYADDKNDPWMKGRAERFADEIQNTTERAVECLESNPSFTESVLFGVPMKKSDVPPKIKDVFSLERAQRIAMNEANVIENYKHHLELKKTQVTHTWDATLDELTRPHHYLADGLTVPIDEPFIIDGEMMMFPGDDSLGATAKNLINCRCVEL